MTCPVPAEFKKFLLYARQDGDPCGPGRPTTNYIISFTVPDIDNVTEVPRQGSSAFTVRVCGRTQAIKHGLHQRHRRETVVSAGSVRPPPHGSLGPCPFSESFPLECFHPWVMIPVPQKPAGALPSSPLTCVLQTPNHSLPTVSPDLPNAHGLAVDWVSRNLFWTSYDTNKKQINVARLDGSFKNAVVQGLEQPHGLVVHPLRVCPARAPG